MAVSMAISMVGAVALATATAVPVAKSDFLYVPPEGPASEEARAAEPDAGGRAAGGAEDALGGREHGPAVLEVVVEDPGSGLWRVRSGEMLREVLRRWGGRAGVEVLVLTDRRYRLHEGRTFQGSFAEASDALFAALAHLPRPPAGTLRADGRTLAVLHQVSLHQASPHQASLHRARRAGEGQ